MKTHKLKVTLNEIKRMQELAGVQSLNESKSSRRNLKEGSYSQIAGVKSEFLNVEEIAKIAEGMAEDLLDSMQGDFDASREDGTASSYSSDIGKEFENASREYAKNFVKDYGIMEDIMNIFDNVFDDFSSRTMD